MPSCTRCGYRYMRYIPRIAGYKCDQCGAIDNEDINSETIAYDKALLKAEEHLIVGNWSQAISSVRHLCDSRPSDPRAYQTLIKAYTENYTIMPSDYNKTEAAACWDKLHRLNKISRELLMYRNKQEKYMREEAENKAFSSVCYVVLFLLMLVITPVAFKLSVVVGIIFIVVDFVLICMLIEKEPVKAVRRHRYSQKTKLNNPFGYRE